MHSPNFAVPVGDILDGDILLVDLAESAEGKIEHGERADAELVRAGLRACSGYGGR